jgi:peptide/nickel transport system ATP-binding protein
VALARAIAVPPPLLLCDEPTSALDVSLAATILNLIGELRRQLSMAVLFVTHDLAVARMIADRVAVMYLGRVVEIGPVQQVTMLPRHPYTAALLASVPEPGAELASPRGEPASLVDLPAGCTFAPRCPRAADDCRAEDPLLVNEQDGPRLGHAVACWHPLSEPGGGT